MDSRRKVIILFILSLIVILIFFEIGFAQNRIDLLNSLIDKREKEYNKKLNELIVVYGCNLNPDDSELKDKLDTLVSRYISWSCNSIPYNHIKDTQSARQDFLNRYIESYKSILRVGADVIYENVNPLYESDIKSATQKYIEKESFLIRRFATQHSFFDLATIFSSILTEAIQGTPKQLSDSDLINLRNEYLKIIQIATISQAIQTDQKIKICAQTLLNQLKNIGLIYPNLDMNIDDIFFKFYYKLLQFWKNPPSESNKYKPLLDLVKKAINAISISSRRIHQNSHQNIIKLINKIQSFLHNPTLEACKEANEAFAGVKQSMEEDRKMLLENLQMIELPPEIKVATTEISIAVIPPIIFDGEHKGTSSLAAITPSRIFDEIKDFLFKLAPTIFTLLLVIGAIFYLLTPINLQNIQKGTEYIKWAVLGYFLLLVVSGIITAIRAIFGGPGS